MIRKFLLASLAVFVLLTFLSIACRQPGPDGTAAPAGQASADVGVIPAEPRPDTPAGGLSSPLPPAQPVTAPTAGPAEATAAPEQTAAPVPAAAANGEATAGREQTPEPPVAAAAREPDGTVTPRQTTGPGKGDVIPQTGTPAIPKVTPTPAPSIFSDEEFRQMAFKYLSETYGVPMGDLRAEGQSQILQYPLIGVTIRVGTFDNDASNRLGRQMKIWRIAIDSNRKVVDFEAVQKAHRDAYRTKYGKLHQVLFDTLQTKGAEEMFKVQISVAGKALNDKWKEIQTRIRNKYPEGFLDQYARPTDKTPSEFWGKTVWPELYRAELEASHAAQAIIVNYLKGLGYEAELGIVATVPKKVILELEKRDDVGSIELFAEMRPALNDASPTNSVPIYWQQQFSGAGTKVGFMDGGSTIVPHPYLNIEIILAGAQNDHPAETAGVANSRHPLYRGIGQDMTVVLADWLVWANALEALLTRDDVLVINHSGIQYADGYIKERDRRVDKVVRWDRRAFVISTGNYGGYVGTPGLGYNAISVGAYDDKNDLKWKGDEMWPNSAWMNPAQVGFVHEKPEVVAPGVRIWTTSNTSPSYVKEDDGTSLAAPAVTGTIGLMFTRNRELERKPEAVRAAIMVSAIHNIYGDPTTNPEPGSPEEDDKDGQGGINTDIALKIAENLSGSGFGWQHDDNLVVADGAGGDFTNGWWNGYVEFNGSQDKRIRAAIAWDSEVPVDYSFINLSTKLNLYLYWWNEQQQQWDLVKQSTSAVDSFQIIDAYAPANGRYQLWVYRSESTEETNKMGLAWAVVDKFWAANDLAQRVGDATFQPNTVFLSVRIDSVTEPRKDVTGGEANYGGFRHYEAKITYPPATINPNHPPVLVRGILGGDPPSPFVNAPNATIRDNEGWATFQGDAATTAYRDVELAKIALKLDGSAKEAHNVYQFFEQALPEYGTGKTVSVQTAIYKQFQRGDAKADYDWNPQDDVNITDAMFIGQYLAGRKELKDLVAPNAASPKHDDPYPYDQITIDDASYIQQMLAGLRDEYFDPIGGLAAYKAVKDGGRAIVEAGVLRLTPSATGRIAVMLKNVSSFAGIGTYDIKITYDPKLIKVNSIEDGAPPFGAPWAYSIDNNNGVILMNGMHTSVPGLAKDAAIAYLNVSALGVSGQSPVRIEVRTLSDVVGNKVTSQVANGAVIVR